MGVVRALCRLLVIQAIKGQTIAADAVFDSKIEPLEELMKGADQHPVVIVRIDFAEQPTSGEGWLTRTGTLSLGLDLIVATKVAMSNGSSEVVIAETDDGLEMSLDILDRQVRLAMSDPTNTWAELFRKLCPTIGSIKDARGIDPESGRKHALRAIEAEIEPIFEPSLGQETPGPITDALNALEAIEDYAGVVGLLRVSLSEGDALFDWQKVQAALGAIASVPADIGVGTPDADSEVPLVATGVRVDGVGGEFVDDTGDDQ